MSAPTRRRAPAGSALSAADLETITAGLASGKRVTVFLREATPSLGLAAGASARVLSVDGTTVTVSPKGVDDQLPYEADELRLTRTEPEPAIKRPATRMPPTPRTPPPVTAKPPTAKPPTAKPVTATPATPEPAATPTPAAPVKPPARRARTAPAPLVITVTSGADDGWTVAVAHGTKKMGKPVEVTADRVARAVRELGDPTATAAVDELVETARAAAQERVEALSRELENARAALERLKNG